MTSNEQVIALLGKANPVPSLALLDPVEPVDTEHLAYRSARSSEMTDVKIAQPKKEKGPRWPRVVLGLAVAAIALAGLSILIDNESDVAAPTTTESVPTPTALVDALNLFEAGTYSATPFAEEPTICVPSQSGCVDPVGVESITFSFNLPGSRNWSKLGEGISYRNNSFPEGAALQFNLGGWVYSEPCTNGEASADIPVGLTVDEFANALAEHPLLEVTTPVDVTLGGYSGKYLDLQVPADITECAAYRAWEYWLYAQGAGHRWHLWILDVDGVRVVVESMDYDATPEDVRAELEGIVNSIQIEP